MKRVMKIEKLYFNTDSGSNVLMREETRIIISLGCCFKFY